MEQGIAREDHFVVAIPHEPANAVLGVACSVKTSDCDAAEVELVAMTRGRRDRLAHLASVNCQVGHVQAFALQHVFTSDAGALTGIIWGVKSLSLSAMPLNIWRL